MNTHQLVDILKLCSFNWFEFAMVLKSKLTTITEEAFQQLLLDFSGQLSYLNLDEKDEMVAEQSRQAYLLTKRTESLNNDLQDGMIVSESDCSDQEIWNQGVSDILGEHGRQLIKKRRAAINRKAVREAKRKLMEQRFLKRRKSKRVSRILTQCPNIGKEIEDFVKDCGAGADAWRRTGVLTFDGNSKVKKKPTFRRVKEHLEDKFNMHISYGSVVQLCMARNKRRRSAARYRGVAQVLQRRARKGFNLKFNPDEHWSSSFYSALNELQYYDGTKVLNIGRDDQAGFRLDTMATHRLHRTLCVKGSDTLTTRTDYTNKYPSTLQTTSYNFPETKTTGELCAGVVKAKGLYEKNAAQHLADLEMISSKEEFKTAFVDKDTNQPKDIEFIRVDGGNDEGPSHCEVQYWWAVRHLKTEALATLVTCRNSGASYRNRVELQNGCLALAHANLFIPSTLNGSCLIDDGKVNQEKLKENLSSAIDVYISRVDGAPCGSTQIHVFRGADSTEYQNENKLVKVFLKGSKKAKEELKNKHPESFEKINSIWEMMQRHVFKDVPRKYIFYLTCCYKKHCIHPRCKMGLPEEKPTWYPGGPLLSYLPLPAINPERPFGREDCQQCKSTCSGHYLKPGPLHKSVSSGASKTVKPPSEVILGKFQKYGKVPSEAIIKETAREVCLTVEEVHMWFQHLSQVQQNRAKGAQKRKGKKRKSQPIKELNVEAEPEVLCLMCSSVDPPDHSSSDVDWVCCDGCFKWCHTFCCGSLASELSEDSWLCFSCYNWDV